MRPFPGPGAGIKVSDGSAEPLWSRDGRTLYYRSGDERKLLAVAIQSSSALVVSAPRFVLARNSTAAAAKTTTGTTTFRPTARSSSGCAPFGHRRPNDSLDRDRLAGDARPVAPLRGECRPGFLLLDPQRSVPTPKRTETIRRATIVAKPTPAPRSGEAPSQVEPRKAHAPANDETA